MGNAEKKARDWPTIAVCVALGIAIGGTLAVPLSLLLPEGWRATFEVNGQIGDFIGGFLNPVVAMAALVWLREGVLSQKQELSATKISLEAAAQAQDRQVQIAAATGLLQVSFAHFTEVQRGIDEIERQLNNLPNDIPQVGYSERMRLTTALQMEHESIRRIREEQFICVKKLRSLLPEMNAK